VLKKGRSNAARTDSRNKKSPRSPVSSSPLFHKKKKKKKKLGGIVFPVLFFCLTHDRQADAKSAAKAEKLPPAISFCPFQRGTLTELLRRTKQYLSETHKKVFAYK
jgi:hypothetical protein